MMQSQPDSDRGYVHMGSVVLDARDHHRVVCQRCHSPNLRLEHPNAACNECGWTQDEATTRAVTEAADEG